MLNSVPYIKGQAVFAAAAALLFTGFIEFQGLVHIMYCMHYQ